MNKKQLIMVSDKDGCWEILVKSTRKIFISQRIVVWFGTSSTATHLNQSIVRGASKSSSIATWNQWGIEIQE